MPLLSSLFPLAHARYSSLPLLGDVWEQFCEWLERQGYPSEAIRRRVRAGPLVTAELVDRQVASLDELTASELRSLAAKPTRWTEQLAVSLVRSLAEFLKEQGQLAPEQTTLTDQKVAAYRSYLVNVRGLAPATVARHGVKASEFLEFLDFDTNPERLSRLSVEDIDVFIAEAGRRLGRVSMLHVTATLRSFLRFLGAEGDVPPCLDASVDSPRCFRGERLPRALPWGIVRSLLSSIDRSFTKGRRDFAMLLLIATYGLRVGEIAALRLGDVAWRSRQLRVPRPKVGTPLLLPLTDEVATALTDYLRHGRTPSKHRQLFLRVRIPPGPIKSTAVCDAFDVWAERAGIRLPRGTGGPHCLRHSLALHLLRQGASVKTIGDLLGHRSAESTCVYLRLQVDDLRDVALPLPKAVSAEVLL